jgi:hypothetical protein
MSARQNERARSMCTSTLLWWGPFHLAAFAANHWPSGWDGIVSIPSRLL